MHIEDIELGQTVICTNLSNNTPKGNTDFRGVGHIGKVVGIQFFAEVVLIAHTEYADQMYVQHLTSYFATELELYEHDESDLRKAIDTLKNQLEI